MSLVWQQFRDSSSHVRMSADIVLRRKAIGLEAGTTQRSALFSGRYPHLEPQIRELMRLRTQFVYKTLSGPTGRESPERHRQTLEGWGVRLERLERDLARQIPELRLEQRLGRVDRNVVVLALPEGATLVEFLRFNVFDFQTHQWKPARCAAFVLAAGQGDAVRMVDLGEAEPIEAMVRTFRHAVEAGSGERDMAAQGQAAEEPWWEIAERLRAGLLDKLLGNERGDPAEVLNAQSSRLFLADGELNLLPFEEPRAMWRSTHLIFGARIIKEFSSRLISWQTFGSFIQR